MSVSVTLAQEEPDYKEGELLIKFKRGATSKAVSVCHSRHGSRIAKRFRRAGIQLLKLKRDLTTKEAIELYKKDPNVEYAEPNYELHALEVFPKIPNDPDFRELWGLDNTGQTGGTPDADIDAPGAWGMTTGSDQIIVAVIDTGVDYNHEDLAANVWVNEAELNGQSGVDDDENGYVDDVYGIDTYHDDADPMDDHGHGTHCSGTIGAVGGNGIGVVGVNWNVKIMALKFLNSGGRGYTSGAIECLDYVIDMKVNHGQNVRITSNSWGGDPYSQSLYETIQTAGAADILFVAAAGNDGEDNDVNPHYPSSYDLPNILSVAATDHDDELAYFPGWWASNYGPNSVDVAAPGANILSTVPGNAYGSGYGTSMATPHVSGLAALILARAPSFGCNKVISTITDTIDYLSSLDGLICYEGRINAERALQSIQKGAVSLDKDVYRPDVHMEVVVMDSDLNTDKSVEEKYTGIVTITTTGGDEEAGITMSETGVDTGVFVGSIIASEAPVTPGNDTLEVKCNVPDTITATYHDTNDGSGQEVDAKDTATTDCFPPDITDGCPDDPNKTDPGICGCGVADTDSDGDETPNCTDAFPDDPDEWLDTDGDGIGNNADLDDDNDGMRDEWELTYGLDPLDETGNNGGDGDFDGDGWSNYDEYTYGTKPNDDGTMPIRPEVQEVIPQDGAGIGDDDTRVPHNTSFAVLIVDSDGIDITDTHSIRFTIDDGVNIDEIDLDDTRDVWVRVTKLNPDESQTAVTQLWAVYHRAEHDPRGNSYFYDNQINITVDARDNTGLPMVQQSHAFKIETETEHDDAEANSPDTVSVANDDPAFDDPEYDAGIEVTSGDLEGAKIIYDNSEPVQPTLGPTDELPPFDEADVDAVGVLMNLQPPTVFNTPVKVFIPCPGYTDVSSISIYLYNGIDWEEAYGAEGLLSGGRGCIVPDSRVNNDPGADQPNVAIKMYHFTGVQAGISTSTPPAPSGDGGDGGGGVGCFIATAAFGSPVEKHVTTLKNFRDTYILPYALGRIFVKTYYKYAPPLAQFITKHETLRAVVRIGLIPLVAISYSTLHFGPVITFTMLMVLLAIPILLVSYYQKKARSYRANS